MGPRSTAPFVDLVIDECKAQSGACFDIDFPQILILSQPTPFYLDRPIDHGDLKQSILQGLRKLEASGVSFVAMPCNTAHLYFDELQGRTTSVIGNIKNSQHDQAMREWFEVVYKAREAGAEAIVSACTDLSVVIGASKIDRRLADSARALAEATVARYLSLR